MLAQQSSRRALERTAGKVAFEPLNGSLPRSYLEKIEAMEREEKQI
jgi:hypothetical protein